MRKWPRRFQSYANSMHYICATPSEYDWLQLQCPETGGALMELPYSKAWQDWPHALVSDLMEKWAENPRGDALAKLLSAVHQGEGEE